MKDLNRHDRLFKRLTFLMATAFVVAVTGCGGGGSSSGGGGGGQFAGRYAGSETLELVTQGQVTPMGTFPLLLVIDGNGSVTVTDVDAINYRGQLSGNKFSATGVYPAIPPCSAANITYQGTIVGDDITGSSNGASTCPGPGGTLTVVMRGPFKVTRNAHGREILGGDDKGQAISNTLESLF
ncbi:MAG: hypothetical protein OES26_14065 [Gammaproteobacteria bacterium]|nr:hypothetical protein [Gammaproteobacteria bacterium]